MANVGLPSPVVPLGKTKPQNGPVAKPPEMSEEERQLQLKKIDLIERMVLLLEEIAFRVTQTRLEKPEYLKDFYAGCKR